MHQLSIPYLFELKLLLTSNPVSPVSHIYVIIF
ncbi:hypothetical protein Gotri_021176 [Gossypium trilobum]|uniref:Uncharacterized protein n=1 Tax=Gossypium trilobum TaxID=34281 RepID=A0A7J9DCH0_9ROSI|nr:hypothetical protein [Gossypium trilobum]